MCRTNRISETMPQRLSFVPLMLRASRIKLGVHVGQAFIWDKCALFTRWIFHRLLWNCSDLIKGLFSYHLFHFSSTSIDLSYRSLHFLSTARSKKNQTNIIMAISCTLNNLYSYLPQHFTQCYNNFATILATYSVLKTNKSKLQTASRCF